MSSIRWNVRVRRSLTLFFYFWFGARVFKGLCGFEGLQGILRDCLRRWVFASFFEKEVF